MSRRNRVRCKTCLRRVRNRVYCEACSPLKDPAWRKQRSAAAGQGSARAAVRRAQERAAGLKPEQAFARGYRTGYVRAYRFWKRWATRTVAQMTGRTVAA